MIKLLACDLDGTLIRWFDEKNGLFSQTDINAITKLNGIDIRFLVNTSRQLHFLDCFNIPGLLNLDTISGAGCEIRLDGKHFFTSKFTINATEELISYFKDVNECQLLAVTNQKRMISTNHKNKRYLRLLNDDIDREYGEISPILLQNYKFSEQETVIFFYINTDLDDNKEFYEKIKHDLPNFEVILCSNEAIQITNLGINKTSALEKVRNYLKIEKHEIAVIGDSFNDIIMFENYPVSFVMRQADSEIQKYAKHQVESVAEAIQILQKEYL